MQTVLSLFDYTGSWSDPFLKQKFNVVTVDIRNGDDILEISSYDRLLDTVFGQDVAGILAAVPCTDFAVSGAAHFKKKDEDGRTELSLSIAERAIDIIKVISPKDEDWFNEARRNGETWFWAIENPVSRIGKFFPEIGKPKYFQPWEYAGWLDLSDSAHNELDRIRRKDGFKVTSDEVNFVVECNAYEKKTGIWGQYNPDWGRKPIEPVKINPEGYSAMHRIRCPKKRSVTPKGFAKAFSNAQKSFVPSQRQVYDFLYGSFSKNSSQLQLEMF